MDVGPFGDDQGECGATEAEKNAKMTKSCDSVIWDGSRMVYVMFLVTVKKKLIGGWNDQLMYCVWHIKETRQEELTFST